MKPFPNPNDYDDPRELGGRVAVWAAECACQEFIERAMKARKWRQRWCVFQAVCQMPSMCWDFYHFHYWGALFSVGLAMGMAALVWWIHTITIRRYQECKRRAAQGRELFQHVLDAYLAHKERGFE